MPRQRSTLSCADLRTFIVRYMPHYQAADAQLIINTRRRIVRFILLHDFDYLPTSNEVVMLADPKAIASNELCLVDNVLFKCNLTKILRKVMQEYISYWKACRFLDNMTVGNPSIRHKVKYDNKGHPEAIAWMFLEVR